MAVAMPTSEKARISGPCGSASSNQAVSTASSMNQRLARMHSRTHPNCQAPRLCDRIGPTAPLRVSKPKTRAISDLMRSNLLSVRR